MSPNEFESALRLAPLGSVLISYGDGDKPSGLKGWLVKLGYDGIRKHQRALWPKSNKTDGVHVQIKVSSTGLMGSWVSAEVPRVIEHFNPAPDLDRRKYRLYAYKFGWLPESEDALIEYARWMVGKDYDLLQLIGIATAEQKWIPKFARHWIGTRMQLPGRKEVCSTLAARALEAARRLAGDLPKPVDVDPFDCTPAHFEHSPNMTLRAEINT